jgi:hypothetical protein
MGTCKAIYTGEFQGLCNCADGIVQTWVTPFVKYACYSLLAEGCACTLLTRFITSGQTN